jgi:hypothetical protein
VFELLVHQSLLDCLLLPEFLFLLVSSQLVNLVFFVSILFYFVLVFDVLEFLLLHLFVQFLVGPLEALLLVDHAQSLLVLLPLFLLQLLLCLALDEVALELLLLVALDVLEFVLEELLLDYLLVGDLLLVLS